MMDWKLILQIAGVILGLLYLYLEYNANIWLWIVGILMPAVHGVLYFKSGLYADFGMQVYYIAAGLWGLGSWLLSARGPKVTDGSRDGIQNDQTSHTSGICRTPLRLWPVLAIIYAVLHIALYFLLSRCTDSTVPFWDAFSTALSIIAMWMLSKKYTEQWLVWLAVDLISVGLYFYKGIPLTACLYILYSGLAVAGFLKWRKMTIN